MTFRDVARRSRPERGNALIEFVLVLPLFLILLLGVIDWGFYFMVRATVINATREGARAGSVASVPGGDDPAVMAETAVQNYLQNALGASYVQTPTVTATSIAGSPGIAVRLAGYAVVPGTTSSITGLEAWTRVPTTITAETDMRLESPGP